MKTVELKYNPYKMKTTMLIDGINVCDDSHYDKFAKFIKNEIPLQTWIEPIPYPEINWNGFVNEVSDIEINDEVEVIFSGREIDFEDLKRSISVQNAARTEKTRVRFSFKHKKILDDKILSQNIEEVVKSIKSERFSELVAQRTSDELKQKYNDLDENYTIAKEGEFYIVLAGVYSSGKSTIINTLIKHDVLPTSTRTCTSKNCRIRHDGSLENKIALICYDENNNIVGERQVFENDNDCAGAFLDICPINDGITGDKHPEICTMELSVDLSHLYPESVNKDKFTIVLVDTPGMDSAQSSEDGTNKHAEISLEAITMKSKPMVILCVDANKYEDDSIGDFMKEIIIQSEEDRSGFNDRFLFLMNKSDQIAYKQNETPYEIESAFAKYLTDSSKWNIKINEDELHRLAESASHFVPRVFMTAAAPALAVTSHIANIPKKDVDDDHWPLRKAFDSLKEEIVDGRHPEKYYLSKYCNIPNYRKDEINAEFKKAIDNEDYIHAIELQCGLVSVESAIKDYIERYAYPIKVRGLLETFDDILEDVNSFNNGILSDLKEVNKELGEKEGAREEAKKRKKGVEDKVAALNRAKEDIEKQLNALDDIQFDSSDLRKATTEFRADIEEDKEIRFIRENKKVMTGQKSHSEVEIEINTRINNIKNLFDTALSKTNKKLKDIKKTYDDQLDQIFNLLKNAVGELEKSRVFQQGEYDFTKSVTWNMNFENIKSDNFVDDIKKNVVDGTITSKKVRNLDRDFYASFGFFSWIRSRFMPKYTYENIKVDGYYETTTIAKSISDYLFNLENESTEMERRFKEIMDNSKQKVRDLINRLVKELGKFLDDIKAQEDRINQIGNSVDELHKEINSIEETSKWLNDLKNKIEEE